MTLEERIIALEAEVQQLRQLVEAISISQVEGDIQITVNSNGPVTVNSDVVEGDYGVAINSQGASAVQMFSDSVEGDMSCKILAPCEQVIVNMNADSVEGDAYTKINAPVTDLVTNTNLDGQTETPEE